MKSGFCPVCYSVWVNGERTCGHYKEKPISEKLMRECKDAYQEGQVGALQAMARKYGFRFEESK
jgi:hypothetical protein